MFIKCNKNPDATGKGYGLTGATQSGPMRTRSGPGAGFIIPGRTSSRIWRAASNVQEQKKLGTPRPEGSINKIRESITNVNKINEFCYVEEAFYHDRYCFNRTAPALRLKRS